METTPLTPTDVLTVEYYDQLSPDAQRAYRASDAWRDYADDADSVDNEFDRIDSGLKPYCLM